MVFLGLEPRLAPTGVQRNAGEIKANPQWLDAWESGVKLLFDRMKRDKGA